MRGMSYRGVPGGAPTALWVVPVADLGGVARHVLDVAAVGLPRTRLVVLCPPGPLAERLRRAGAAVLVEDLGPEHGLAASVAALRHAVATGTDPVPIVGALAAKIRQLARLAAIGGRRDMNPSDIGMSPWQVKRAREDLAGWSDDALAAGA